MKWFEARRRPAPACPNSFHAPVKTGLAHRRGVDDAAVLVLRVEAALEADRRAGADELLEDLAVVADLLDDVVGPLVVEPQHLAHVPLGAEEPVDVRIAGALGHL